MLKLSRIVLLQFIMFIFLSLMCSKSDPSDNSSKKGIYSGKLTSSYNDVNQIWVLRSNAIKYIYTKELNGYGDDEIYKYEINADRTFIIDMSSLPDKDPYGARIDWIMIMVNTNASLPRDVYKGNIGIKDLTQVSRIGSRISLGGLGGIDSILGSLPEPDVNSVDLGEINQSSADSSLSESTVTLDDSSSSYTVPISELRELSNTDTPVHEVKNYFITGVTGYVNKINVNSVHDISTITDSWSSPSDIKCDNFNIALIKSTSEADFDDTLIANGSQVLKLYPPGQISYQVYDESTDTTTTYTFNESTPIQSDTIPWFPETSSHFLFESDPGNYTNIYYGFNSATSYKMLKNNGFKGDIPSGYFILKKDSSDKEYHLFDLSCMNIFKNGRMEFYNPSARINTDSSGIIQSIEIKFYYYSQGSFTELKDYTNLFKNIDGIYLSYLLDGVSGFISIDRDTSVPIVITPADKININNIISSDCIHLKLHYIYNTGCSVDIKWMKP